MAFGPKAQPFAQRRAQPWKTRIPHKKFLFVPAAPPFLRNGGAAGTKRKGVGPHMHQGCALRWANGWAFGPKNLSQPDSPHIELSHHPQP